MLILTCVFLFACQSAPVQQTNNNVASTETESDAGLTLDELCQNVNCRVDYPLKLRTGDGEIDQVIPLYWPIAHQDQISLLPGDELFIEAEQFGNVLGNFKVVDEVLNPEKTLEFSFTQKDSKLDMWLRVKNPFSKSIKYHINMVDFSGKPHETSSCPVKPGILVIEQWSHPIFELALSNMHFIEDSDSFTCEY